MKLAIVIAAIVVFVIIKKLLANKNQKKMVKLVNSGNTLIVDVRSKEEFRSGHIEKSVNIPLDSISGETEKLRHYDSVIVVCASGMRSMQAKSILHGKGLKNVYNGGAWQGLNSKIV